MKTLVRLKRSSITIISHIGFMIEFSSPGARYHVTQALPMIGQWLRMVAQLSDCLLSLLLVVLVSVTLRVTGFSCP